MSDSEGTPLASGRSCAGVAPADFDPVAYINEPRWQQSRLGLERIEELLRRMGNPQDKLRFIHVAGTNGKGSVSAYLASVLQAAGYRTGLFTSPYIYEFAERIQVDRQPIQLEELRETTLFVREHAEAMVADGGEHPTEFELMCAVAFEAFRRRGCGIVVCEVGLGGRLDSTNVIARPELCVITPIGFDHTDILGDTLGQIAREKAGIIKPGVPVVSWPQESDAQAVIKAVCADKGCELYQPDPSQLAVGEVDARGRRLFTYRGVRYSTGLLGSYQPSNAILAIEALSVLMMAGWSIPDEAVASGIAATAWPGRFELVAVKPRPVIVDGGHNPQGALALSASLQDVFPGEKAVFVMGVLADKDYPAMIEAVMPLASAIVCVTPPIPRALAAADLAQAIGAKADPELPIVVAASYEDALDQAYALAQAHDEAQNPVQTSNPTPICVFGSLYNLALAMQAIRSV